MAENPWVIVNKTSVKCPCSSVGQARGRGIKTRPCLVMSHEKPKFPPQLPKKCKPLCLSVPIKWMRTRSPSRPSRCKRCVKFRHQSAPRGAAREGAIFLPLVVLVSSKLRRHDLPSLSHEYTLGAAPSLSIVVANVHRLDRTSSIRHATALRVALHFAIVPSDLANDIVECLVNVDS